MAKSPDVRLVEAFLERCPQSDAYSSAFLETLDSGGAWSAEACRVIAIAAQYQLVLNEQLLTLSDVRDLQRYRLELTKRLRPSKGV